MRGMRAQHPAPNTRTRHITFGSPVLRTTGYVVVASGTEDQHTNRFSMKKQLRLRTTHD